MADPDDPHVAAGAGPGAGDGVGDGVGAGAGALYPPPPPQPAITSISVLLARLARNFLRVISIRFLLAGPRAPIVAMRRVSSASRRFRLAVSAGGVRRGCTENARMPRVSSAPLSHCLTAV